MDNLLTNSVQACPAGQIHISLIVQADRVVIRVCDEGPGFTREVRERLFEPFFTTKAHGTGLGLASCMTIMKAHSGGIEVPLEGSAEVVLWLPCHRSDQADNSKFFG